MHGMNRAPCGFSALRLLIGCGKMLYVVGGEPLRYTMHLHAMSQKLNSSVTCKKPSSQRRRGRRKGPTLPMCCSRQAVVSLFFNYEVLLTRQVSRLALAHGFGDVKAQEPFPIPESRRKAGASAARRTPAALTSLLYACFSSHLIGHRLSMLSVIAKVTWQPIVYLLRAYYRHREGRLFSDS